MSRRFAGFSLAAAAILTLSTGCSLAPKDDAQPSESPGKKVTRFDPVTIDAVPWDATRVPEPRAGSSVIPEIDVPAVQIPATAAETGCMVEFEAPAGCLPRVELSPAWIPEVTVPGYEYPDADGTVHTVEGTTLPAESTGGKVADHLGEHGVNRADHRDRTGRNPARLPQRLRREQGQQPPRGDRVREGVAAPAPHKFAGR